MRKLPRILFCFAAAIAVSFGTAAVYSQQPQASAPAQTGIKTATEEVLLDVVVRDKKGHAVNDLKPDDFQILDDGEPKKITSFRLVQGGEAISAGGSRTQLDPLRQIRLVTMIFHCYSNDDRRLASSAALDLLKGELPQNVYMAIMAIDHKLEVLQPFTNDPALLKKAIQRATGSQNADFSKDTEIARAQLQEMLGPTTGEQSAQGQVDNLAASATAAAQAQNPNGAAFANVAMAQMLLQMINTEQSTAGMESGRAEIWSLLDAVKEQYRLPGRKTILYFSEGGFVIPQGMEQPFKNVISIANRSNVSIYAVDTHGLTTWSNNQAGIDALNRAAQASRDQQTTTGEAVRPDQAALIDTSIESTRANTQNTLANLAESTGGALIANTNDLRAPLHKLAEDIQTYYEISYNPEIKTYDGSFRKITIKMDSSDLRVQARSGYIALPPALAAGGTVLRPFEVPLLTALGSAELPTAFGFRSTAMHFRGRQNQPVCELVVDVPLANVTLEKKGADAYEGRLSYVAVLKDSGGAVVKKFENEIPINVPAAKLEALKASHFIYTEHFDLPPGQYTLEAAVLDGEDNKISAQKSSVVMPPPSTALGISSVAVVRTTKDKDSSTENSDPLLIATKVISPTLDPVISKTGTASLPFYVVIYPDKSVAAPPQLVMEFSRNGEVLGSGSPKLGPPDQDGRIQYVAMAPIAQLEPGEFTIRFIVKQGSETAEEKASFTLQ
ncbi:MAG TPA: VWA domain-containing protein [Terriglobia bacterium]|nr:VWA domain-containing protein [Terriglobia bacterium]